MLGGWLVHQLELPKALNLFGKKPWEIKHLDTLELWKFGDYKNYTSLNLLTKTLGIKTPKDDINGDQVAQVYYQNNDLERIIKYCEKDTIAVAQIVLKYTRNPLLNDDSIIFV